MKNANGINPIIAILLTLCVCVLCVVFFITRHPVWGTIFALITLDFAADVVLSLTPRK
ncbi:MAG: hypothetical protein IJ788_01600 [Oscillospiraceae bacterium]|nr:hypothetical protein [Oscillospiraceae bacterium]